MDNIDWWYLKKAITVLFLVILFVALISYAGQYYESKAYEAYQQSTSTLRSTHNLYKNMVNDLDLLEQYKTKFNQYKSSGLVGGERRLSWIESLQATNEVIRLPKLNYNLQPQETFVRPEFKPGRNVDVKSSPMVLDMELLHEEDLFAVLEGLRLSIDSLFTIDSCEIRRSSSVGRSFDTKKSNMRSSCVIRWVTVDAS